MSNAQTSLSIVIVNYHSDDHIAKIVHSLDSLLRANTVDIIVVDNSGDCCLGGKAPNTLIVDPGYNLGFSRACALGAAHAKSPNLFFCNPDVELSKEAVAVAITAQNSHPDITVIAPVTGSGTLLCAPTGLIQPLPDRRFGPAFLIRKSDLEALGGWDPGFFLWWEDTDLEIRLARSGRSFGFIDGLVLPHIGGHSTSTTHPKKQKLLTRVWISSRCRFLIKHYGFAAALLYCLAGLAANFARVALFRRTIRDYHSPKVAAIFFLACLANLWRLSRYVTFDGRGFPWDPTLAFRPTPTQNLSRQSMP